MRGRHVLGLSHANRQAAGVVTGDEVEIDVEFDAEPRVVVELADFARALNADPVARTAYDRLAYGRKLQHVRAIESAKKPETRRGARSGDPVGSDDLLSAAHELQRLAMPPTEIHTVLVTDDRDVVRRLMALHRERLQEWLADEVATVGRIEASLSEAIRARTRARSAMTLVAGEETPQPDQVGTLAAEA